MLLNLVHFALFRGALGDVYLHSPRGSNNKLSEQSNTVQNANRLFDSQNNGAGGYQIGDACQPVCQDGNRNYDETKVGAMQGRMSFYQGSELYIEWVAQHGCGLDHPNLRCQMVLQYMSEADNPRLRDGTKRGNQNTAGGTQEPPTAQDAGDITLGQQEPLEFYLACKARERNKGLYTADQQVRDDVGATATRQNPNGNSNANQRHGLECQEERDYYPYWHPTPWHDIAVITDEPQVRCSYYQAESQNVMRKGFCSVPQFNNARACTEGGGAWQQKEAFGENPPECSGTILSRDNHNGNVRNGVPMYYVWRLPEHLSGPTVLRLRYNITTKDFDPGSTITSGGDGPASQSLSVNDPFFVDQAFNDRNPSQRRRTAFQGGPPVLATNPQADFLNMGAARVLQLEVNTNQLGRTFQDRTHSFFVRARPVDTPGMARIVNYNVRGRRGNIVQVYPSVEYDFVPPDLTVQEGDFIHFQWTASDANANNNAGNGRQGTDRSNLVQVASRGENVPLPVEEHTLLFNARNDPGNTGGRQLVDRFAYLDQDSIVTCNPRQTDDQAVDNCKQLNGASAYFDGGLVEMTQVGAHHIASTRNNDFSNRSQKASITVTRRPWPWYSILSLVLGSVILLALGLYFLAALYAFKRPSSFLFSKRYRPRVLRLLVSKATLQKKLEQRRAHRRETQEMLAAALMSADDDGGPTTLGRPCGGAQGAGIAGTGTGAAPPVAGRPPVQRGTGFAGRQSLQGCGRCGLREQRLVMATYALLNVVVFFVGFFSYLGDGFQQSLAYPMAKGAGFTLDLNFAVIVLPTLKSLQTALRGAGATREWIPIDDPISFHINIAGLITLGTVVHVASHVAHMARIRAAPVIQNDPLELWDLTDMERKSGTALWKQIWDIKTRCAPFSGILLILLILAMGLSALPCARRGANCLTRRLGGYNLFWKIHRSWTWIYVLLLVHAPARLWIWLFFPAIFVAVDRVLLANRHRPYAVLRKVRALPRDVISLTFDVPPGFAYEAGQYVLLGWRGEWHPFTLTSAPEERCLSVHIRAPSTLDWCSALRQRLLVEAPAAAARAAIEHSSAERGSAERGSAERSSAERGSEAVAAPPPGGAAVERPRATTVEYAAQACPRSHVVYCRPVQAGAHVPFAAPVAPLAAGRCTPCRSEKPRHVVPDLERTTSMESVLLSKVAEVLPEDAVVLQLSGPFGAPAQKVWQFETIMAVGAGIGVTPFASILKSVQLRLHQRQAIQGTLAASQPRPTKATKKECQEDSRLLGARESMEQLLRDVVTVPKRIYFYWIVRGQDELEWFYDLLADAVEGPARENVHISVFLTGEVELKQVRELKCTQEQYFGRPNWGRIFKQVREEHKGEHVGVFLCGSPVIGQELSRESCKHTDPIDVPNGTRFSFFKEHF